MSRPEMFSKGGEGGGKDLLEADRAFEVRIRAGERRAPRRLLFWIPRDAVEMQAGTKKGEHENLQELYSG